MTIRRIEIPLYVGESVEAVLDAALAVADRFESFLDVRVIRPPSEDIALYVASFSILTGDLLTRLEEEARQNAIAVLRNVRAWCDHRGVEHGAAGSPGKRPRLIWHEEAGTIRGVAVARGRLADLTVLQRPASSQVAFEEAFESAVFSTGRPVLIVGPARPATGLLDHVAIAWNGSLEAARALALGMPMIAAAGRVSVFCARGSGDELETAQPLLAYLRDHGIDASETDAGHQDRDVGAALLDAVSRQQVSLLVMGAYSHGRMRQTMLGGVTRDVLAAQGVAVLMAH